MKVLITGASGFLGRHTVAAFLAAGHEVRAMVRPASKVERLGWGDEVEVFRGDLRGSGDLEDAFEGVDVLVHLAACVVGDDETRFGSTVVGTERLLDAMVKSDVKRVVLASSYSLYDYEKVGWTMREDSPLAEMPYDRDSYAVAKVWQERVTRQYGEKHGWDVRVLRPGFIWGVGNAWLACCGMQGGGKYVVVNPCGKIPLTHVENCADAFVRVSENDRAAGETFNVVDNHGVRNWRYVGDYRKGTGEGGMRIPVPYVVGLLMSMGAKLVSRIVFGKGGKLPSLFVPCRYRARFRTPWSSHKKLKAMIGWEPPLSYGECLKRTYKAEESGDDGGGAVEQEGGDGGVGKKLDEGRGQDAGGAVKELEAVGS